MMTLLIFVVIFALAGILGNEMDKFPPHANGITTYIGAAVNEERKKNLILD